MAELIIESTAHKMVDGDELVRLRNERGWSQAYLAGRVSGRLNRDYLSRIAIVKLEKPGVHEVTAAMAEALEGIFFRNVTD